MNITEYMGDVVQCHFCKQQGRRTYHFDVDSRCPECGAGLYWQCHPIDGDDLSECAQIALNQKAMRSAKWILEHADQNTRNEIIKILNRVIITPEIKLTYQALEQILLMEEDK